jgi:O-antigen/teichoic acid export membrane protein
VKSQIHKFLNIEIVKNVSVLSIGTIGSQLIPLLFAPIIARLYSPNEFGLFAFVLGGVNIAAVVINGRYDLSVVLPRNQSQAIDLVKGSWIIGFTLSALFTIILLLTRNDLAEFLDYQISIIECIILGLIVSNIAISQPLNFYLIREKAFAQIAKNKIVKGVGCLVYR